MAQPVYTVTSILDNNSAGTLRTAIQTVNADPTYTTIGFDFSSLGTGPYTINLLSSLDPITRAYTINGYLEPSASPGPINGRKISVNINGGGNSTNGFDINASGVTISGLAIYGNTASGIQVEPGASNVTIWGNYIGTLNDGTLSVNVNAKNGITVGILGNTTWTNGIVIGTNGDGTNDANEGNLISANGSNGPVDGGVLFITTNNSKISGNIIGLGKDGVQTTGFGNNGPGVIVGASSVGDIVGTNGDNVSDALEQNIISNNGRHGVWLAGRVNANTVAGNIIGLASTGTIAGNSGYGVSIESSYSNIIGTNADGNDDAQEKNFISGNGTGGVLITGGNLGNDTAATGNVIAGNTIGLALDNSTAAGNAGDGILLNATNAGFQVSKNTIGSDGSGSFESVKGNIIASNSFNGVNLVDGTTSGLVKGNRISKNSIFNNAGLGISLTNPGGSVGSTGVTPNQLNGVDPTGNNPNDLLNFPVITSVTSDASSNITFQGFARPGALVEFYLTDKGQTSPAPPPGLSANFGQGKTFLFQAQQGGTLNGITDAGNMSGSYTNTQAGTGSNGPSPITNDPTFSFTVPNSQLGLAGSTPYTFSALAIDIGTSGSGTVNNTSSFGGNMDATFGTLPVTLVNFSGREDGGNIALQWTTTNEVNNLRFDVQRSADGASGFTTIGQVKGEGTTDLEHTYTFVDTKPNANVNFYRLSQVDIDGHSTFSKILVFRNTASNNVQVYPTVFTDNLNITVNTPGGDELLVRFFDQNGRILHSFHQTTGSGVNSFNLSTGLGALAPGTYIVSINGRTVSYTQQVIKN